MTLHPNAENNLESFDALWSYGDPVVVEQKMQELLPKAEALQDKSIYLQMLSQIALAQAMQKKFVEAHKTLDKAKAQLTPEYTLAHVRILLERGRVYQQADDITQAIKYYEQSYELSKKHNLDFHTINAAHMIAIVADRTEDKIRWNKLALDLATKTKDKRAQDWDGSLYNNLGRNYMDAHEYEQALAMFQEALERRKEEGYAPNIRIAKWQVACALRKLGRLDEALSMLLALVSENDAIAKSGNYDVPVIQMFNLVRGWVYEELAEIYYAKENYEKAKEFAQLAYDDLSNDEMMRKTEAHRLERLKELIEPYNEKNKTMNTFLTQDNSGNSIRLEWEKIDGQSAELTQKIKSVSDILIQTYTKQELQFARIHPEAIPNEHFLKSLAPLFKDGTERIDWKLVEEQINTIFRQFFTSTNFAQFSSAGEKHFFVMAKDPHSDQILGFIQFLVNPEYPSGSVKAGMFGIIPEAHNRGLEKILMSSIFKLMPELSRIFVHTRATNEKELAMYQSWGFVHTQQGYWVNSEYLATQSRNLQEEK